jgi:hypothetical protein
MFNNKQALIGLYSNTVSLGAQLINFTVTTTSGNIQIKWGDGVSEFINSNIAVNHNFYCPDYSAPSGFWNNINPCIS